MEDNIVDQQLGMWLKERRVRLGFSINHVALNTGISMDRIKNLEEGDVKISILMTEVNALATLYRLDKRAVLKRAIGQ